jgi:apolipoprotein N-acyltransferase
VKLARASAPIVLASGWQRAAIAFLAGAASTLSQSPIDFWPAMLVTFPLLVWLVDGASGRWGGVLTAAVTGWWFGFGYFLAGLYWIGFAFLVDAKTFAWLLPLAVTGLPAYLAIYTALALAVARAVWTHGHLRILTLAVALTASEWLRGHLLTGFPWNAFGYALSGPLVLAQSASLFGLWGMTFLAVAIFASPAVLADDPGKTPHPWAAPTLAAIVFAALAVFGAVRLATIPVGFVEGVNLRIMQPNLVQDDRFNYSAKQSVMDRYLALSKRPSSGAQITHLIWPESAFPFLLTREPDVLAAIATLLAPDKVLITGAARADDPAPNSRVLHAYNSIYVIDHNGSILSVYDKVHLVPFGEYLPFQNFLESLGLMQLTKVRGGFDTGPDRHAMTLPHAPSFLPLICYEVIFPHAAVPRGERPNWIVNLTNDGWFGVSTGPYQHFQQARVRAIEEGLPLVRAANTGISAVIDPLGRIVASLPLGAEGVLDSRLPQHIDPPPYARFGDGPIAIVLAALALVILARRARKL